MPLRTRLQGVKEGFRRRFPKEELPQLTIPPEWDPKSLEFYMDTADVTIVNMIIWRNGFQLNNGPLLPHIDKTEIPMVFNGQIPPDQLDGIQRPYKFSIEIRDERLHSRLNPLRRRQEHRCSEQIETARNAAAANEICSPVKPYTIVDRLIDFGETPKQPRMHSSQDLMARQNAKNDLRTPDRYALQRRRDAHPLEKARVWMIERKRSKLGPKAYRTKSNRLAALPRRPSRVAPRALKATPTAADWQLQLAYKELNTDFDQDTVTITFRLPNKQPLEGVFNYTHTLIEVRRFIKTARRELFYEYFTMSTTWPSKTFNDFSTLEQVKLRHNTIVVKVKKFY